MLATSRLIQIGALLSLIAAGCGGGSSASPTGGPDASDNTDASDIGQGSDSGTSSSSSSSSSGGSSGSSGSSGGSATPDGGNADGAPIDACSTPATTTCNVHATCTNSGTSPGYTCACTPPYTGDGTNCTCVAGTAGCGATNGATCGGNGDCQNGYCVSGVCCASACSSAPACQTATGATCGGGATCVYPNMPDSTGCDDSNACTTTDVCTNGACVGGPALNCDDSNICTADTCVPATGCAHSGVGIVTLDCQPRTLCTSYACASDKAGTCQPTALVDCSSSKDECNAGVCSTSTGTCSAQPANDGNACDQGSACATGNTCHSGVCNGGTPISCDDGNGCTDDSCDPVLGCKNVNNTATCSDGNPCTVGDQCSGGACHGTAMDCSAQNDQCNVGVCAAGSCGKSPVANTTACNDGHSCTTTDVCTNGACVGSGDACGANATGCTDGTPNTCTCATNYVNAGGACVLNTNACASSPCVANATCSDPSNTSNGAVCTCPAGYTGDGKTSGTGCTAPNNCAGNPCGAGTCVNGTTGYTCNCSAGYTSVGGTCVCDMNGTFATQYSFSTSWSGITDFENGTNVTSTTWAIRTQTYDSSGNLTVKTTQCGGTTFDLCTEGSPLGDEAYAQYFPITDYDLSTMSVATLSMTLSSPLPGKAYVEPQTAALLGISLTDPLGAWPASVANIGAGGSQTNGAAWVDNDNDGFIGVTSYAVPPGGVATSDPSHPLQTYGAKSVACPRRSSTLARLAYNYLPAIDTANLSVDRVKRLYTAQRTISSMSGTISSCDLIQGTLGGPDSGEPAAAVRIGGCVRVNGTGEINCTAAISNVYDTQNQTQEHISSGSFIVKRITAGTSCSAVRAMSFP